MGAKWLIVLCWWCALPAWSSLSSEPVPYYGKEFYEKIYPSPPLLSVTSSPSEIRKLLFKILSSYHITGSSYDEIAESCPESDRCYRHLNHSYRSAREHLFGHLDLQEALGGFFLTCVYCEIEFSEEDFEGSPPGPGQIPDHYLVNSEHTWPQSKFSSKQPKSLQKSDLHSLFPTYSRVNSSRSNLPFGEVDVVTSEVCPGARRGYSNEYRDITFFEPPDSHKGNVARAMFYFSVRYKADLDRAQESFLRQWHELDPVDEAERLRHEEIFAFQEVRNPFVDHPELVDQVQEF